MNEELQRSLTSSTEEMNACQDRLVILTKELDRMSIACKREQFVQQDEGEGEKEKYIVSEDTRMQKRAKAAESNLVALRTASLSVIKTLREELSAVRSNAHCSIADCMVRLAILEAGNKEYERVVSLQLSRMYTEQGAHQSRKQNMYDDSARWCERLMVQVEVAEATSKRRDVELQNTKNIVRDLQRESNNLKSQIETGEGKTVRLEERIAQLQDSNKEQKQSLRKCATKAQEGEKKRKSLRRTIVEQDSKTRELQNPIDATSLAADNVHVFLGTIEEKLRILEERKSDCRLEKLRNGGNAEWPLSIHSGLSDQLETLQNKLYESEDAKNNALLKK